MGIPRGIYLEQAHVMRHDRAILELAVGMTMSRILE